LNDHEIKCLSRNRAGIPHFVSGADDNPTEWSNTKENAVKTQVWTAVTCIVCNKRLGFMNNVKKCGLIVLLAVHALCAQVLQVRADDLVTGFQDPADGYKPSCYWY
jgi:hypothetical protein